MPERQESDKKNTTNRNYCPSLARHGFLISDSIRNAQCKKRKGKKGKVKKKGKEKRSVYNLKVCVSLLNWWKNCKNCLELALSHDTRVKKKSQTQKIYSSPVYSMLWSPMQQIKSW